MIAALLAAQAAAADNADACEAPNPIVVENALPGVGPEYWDVNGAGCHEAQGFATRASILPGASVSFKIKMSFDEALRIDVYRLGYYGGAGARKVGEATLVPNAVQTAVTQPDCLIPEPEAALWDCGNWKVTAVWTVPANATSGYYIARAVLPGPDPLNRWREDASRHNYDPHHAVAGADPKLPPTAGRHAYGALGRNRLRNALREPRASHMFFVVRASPESGLRGLLFQTAEQTAHAYNGYGRKIEVLQRI